MNVPGLTREHVSSRLQKYNLQQKKVSCTCIASQYNLFQTPNVWLENKTEGSEEKRKSFSAEEPAPKRRREEPPSHDWQLQVEAFLELAQLSNHSQRQPKACPHRPPPNSSLPQPLNGSQLLGTPITYTGLHSLGCLSITVTPPQQFLLIFLLHRGRSLSHRGPRLHQSPFS